MLMFVESCPNVTPIEGEKIISWGDRMREVEGFRVNPFHKAAVKEDE